MLLSFLHKRQKLRAQRRVCSEPAADTRCNRLAAQRILARALQPASHRLETEPARDLPLQADKTAQTRSAPDLSPPAGAQQALTPREREVLSLVLRGMSNLEIAAKLYISAHTVKNHVTKILDKLGVSDRTQALAKIYGNRLNAASGGENNSKTK